MRQSRPTALHHELAFEFGSHRTTFAAWPKMARIAMRRQSPTPDTIESMLGF
jgi:hypothetical protein